MEKNYVVGVDIGGQTSKCGVVDKNGNVLAQTVIRSDNHDVVASKFKVSVPYKK